MPRGPFVSHLRQVKALHKRFAQVSLRASAIVVQNQAKRNVRGGFSSGDWVTGNLMNSITHKVDTTQMLAQVGTVVNYGAFWELGHWNPFTRKYHRYPWLAPAFAYTTREQQEAVVNAIKREEKKSALAAVLGSQLRSNVNIT